MDNQKKEFTKKEYVEFIIKGLEKEAEQLGKEIKYEIKRLNEIISGDGSTYDIPFKAESIQKNYIKLENKRKEIEIYKRILNDVMFDILK